ncbi:MAG TPA: isoprenylcysteine carboxylmethyltransferase family protein [Vicinamibacterales bacterium]|nr:isoprenylcysteine carboxylmethyltransferase family protein [Vicinamibacterales bacterium]
MPILVLSVLATGLMVAGLVLEFAVHALLVPIAWVIVLQLSGVALMFWARLTFRGRSFHLAANPTEGGLVTTGPYRYVRHPIYTAACVISWPGAIAAHTPVALGAAVLVGAGAVIRMLCEERLLGARYPDYQAYARNTRRMIPGVW